MRAEWIWYPGEFELHLLGRVERRRYYRLIPQYPPWESYGVTPCVKFAKEFTLARPEEVEIFASGPYSVELDSPGRFVPCGGKLFLSAGEHSLCFHVACGDGNFPCLYVKGEGIATDESWYATVLDGTFVHAAGDGFFGEDECPCKFRLPVRRRRPVAETFEGGARLYDFGEQILGSVRFRKRTGRGTVAVCYGETKEEALDRGNCEQLDELRFPAEGRTEIAKAFRYLGVFTDGDAGYGGLTVEEEYSPHPMQAEFTCADGELTQIWQVALKTFLLNAREFFLDGVKRDRWVWSGDAMQSCLMDRYAFCDLRTERRTLVALAGKGTPKRHINTIIDYTPYWIVAFGDYCSLTDDRAFLARMYPRMREWMEFCISRTDGDGFFRSVPEDWVFIDWSSYIDKNAEVYSFLQFLYLRALNAAAACARSLGKEEDASRYASLAERLKEGIERCFWDGAQGGYVYGMTGGKGDGRIFRQQNVMALLSGAAAGKEEILLRRVLLNREVPAVETPFMRFFEYEALCEAGQTAYVLNEVKKYFGGMLSLGANTFWELYREDEEGSEHYAMYGRKYGKSLCHAWGATPLYLVGKYLLGVDTRGGLTVSPDPVLGDFSARVPLKEGMLELSRKGDGYRLLSPVDGVFRLGGRELPIKAGVPFTAQV